MNNFKNETGYTKHLRKSLQATAPPPPRPQLVRPLHSRQQDPLLANAAQLVSASAPSNTTPQVQVSAPAPEPAPEPEPDPAPTPPHATAVVEGQDASPAPPSVDDSNSPRQTTSHGEPPPPG